MASYADNRNALFGTSKDAKPKPKPQKKSYTLGGQSKAAQQRQRRTMPAAIARRGADRVDPRVRDQPIEAAKESICPKLPRK